MSIFHLFSQEGALEARMPKGHSTTAMRALDRGDRLCGILSEEVVGLASVKHEFASGITKEVAVRRLVPLRCVLGGSKGHDELMRLRAIIQARSHGTVRIEHQVVAFPKVLAKTCLCRGKICGSADSNQCAAPPDVLANIPSCGAVGIETLVQRKVLAMRENEQCAIFCPATPSDAIQVD